MVRVDWQEFYELLKISKDKDDKSVKLILQKCKHTELLDLPDDVLDKIGFFEIMKEKEMQERPKKWAEQELKKWINTNEKIYINVNYCQKEKAKSLGAKWDSLGAKWYSPNKRTHKILLQHFEADRDQFDNKKPESLYLSDSDEE
jgi:hypothetical protein